MITFHVVTLFPESLGSYLESSIVARAIKAKKIKVKTVNIFDFIKERALPAGRQERPDDKSYGGGPGMVLRAKPLLMAVNKVVRRLKKSPKIVIFSPSGQQFNNQLAIKWAKEENIVLIAGRYEGIDARVKKILKACLPAGRATEISIGPYILTGGELPALVVLDAVARQVPGVLGKFESLEEGRAASSEVYTRPEVLTYKGKKYRVPKILLSGHHQKIEEWRQAKKP